MKKLHETVEIIETMRGESLKSLKNLMQKMHDKLDKVDQVGLEVCQDGQLGHAKNRMRIVRNLRILTFLSAKITCQY